MSILRRIPDPIPRRDERVLVTRKRRSARARSAPKLTFDGGRSPSHFQGVHLRRWRDDEPKWWDHKGPTNVAYVDKRPYGKRIT
jgi:hypothetical protein